MPTILQTNPASKSGRRLIMAAYVGLAALVLLLALLNLDQYPLTWYDEGSHLHVPKTLVRFGEYADYSSEGFRYYGPTTGVGPTVMLPVALVFKLFGIGLLQARLVIAVYLIATIYVFYWLARQLVPPLAALAAAVLLVVTPGVALVEYGRQVLGEVPGLFFMVAGLLVWFSAWEKPDWKRLGLAGLLLGLATVTKNQYLLILVPAVGIAFILNLIYYRLAPQRVFIIPGLLLGACYAAWQVYLIMYLGPATAGENWRSLQVASSGAAFVFSPNLMVNSLRELLSLKVFFGWLIPVLIYGFVVSLPRRVEAQKWGMLYAIVVFNLAWYVFASIGWFRYAFPALAVSSLFVARFFFDLSDGYRLSLGKLWNSLRSNDIKFSSKALQPVLTIWFAAMIFVPLVEVIGDVASPPFNSPAAMAVFMNEQVPQDALVETWEPEMGFLTNHNYHFPPQLLLDTAVGYAWRGGPAPSESYHFIDPALPDYVLVGKFSRAVDLYPLEVLDAYYSQVTSIGDYTLYQVKN